MKNIAKIKYKIQGFGLMKLTISKEWGLIWSG